MGGVAVGYGNLYDHFVCVIVIAGECLLLVELRWHFFHTLHLIPEYD